MGVKGTVAISTLTVGSSGLDTLTREESKQPSRPEIGKHCSSPCQMLLVMDPGPAISAELKIWVWSGPADLIFLSWILEDNQSCPVSRLSEVLARQVPSFLLLF